MNEWRDRLCADTPVYLSAESLIQASVRANSTQIVVDSQTKWFDITVGHASNFVGWNSRLVTTFHVFPPSQQVAIVMNQLMSGLTHFNPIQFFKFKIKLDCCYEDTQMYFSSAGTTCYNDQFRSLTWIVKIIALNSCCIDRIFVLSWICWR